MPSFYSHGGAMLTPETIEARKNVKSGKPTVFTNKKALVSAVVDLRVALGEKVITAQIIKYEAMRRDQLEELHGMYLKKQTRTAKVSVAGPKEEAPKTATIKKS